jgi:uncharacterized integral membrane protein
MELKKTQDADKSSVDDFVCFSLFAVLFKEKLIINFDNRNRTISIRNIKKVVMLKKRNFRWNLLIGFLLFTFLLYFFYFQNQLSSSIKIVLITCSVLLAIAFFFIKEIKYKLILLLNDDEIVIKVKKEDKDKAKTLMSKINKRIKETKLIQQSA